MIANRRGLRKRAWWRSNVDAQAHSGNVFTTKNGRPFTRQNISERAID